MSTSRKHGSTLKGNRILYKLSGEILKGDGDIPFDGESIKLVCQDIIKVVNSGVQICLVVGGGNLMRGRSVSDVGIGRISGDYMGMLATAMNAIALKDVLIDLGAHAVVMSSIRMEPLCDFYNHSKANKLLSNGGVVIFATGLGIPLFSTDSSAAARAIELQCDFIAKGTSVDGVYSSDPKKNPKATYFKEISFADVVSKNLGFIDQSAAVLLNEHDTSMKVFSIKNNDGNALYNMLCGRGKFSTVYSNSKNTPK